MRLIDTVPVYFGGVVQNWCSLEARFVPDSEMQGAQRLMPFAAQDERDEDEEENDD